MHLSLLSQASDVAYQHGHRMSHFSAEGHGISEAECLQCGMTLQVNTRFQLNEAQTTGEALVRRCPKPHAHV